MRHAGTLVLALVLAGCSATAQAPALVRPTLVAVEGMGFRCDDGIPDNVPSGLVQWTCPGTVEGTRASVLVEGNADGVASVMLVVDGRPDPAIARRGWAQLAGAVPPLSAAPAVGGAIVDWVGVEPATREIDGVRIRAECDEFQCIVNVVPDGDVLRPLPLP